MIHTLLQVEILSVLHHVQKVAQEELAVLTPYSAQEDKIKRLADKAGLSKVSVTTIIKSQGLFVTTIYSYTAYITICTVHVMFNDSKMMYRIVGNQFSYGTNFRILTNYNIVDSCVESINGNVSVGDEYGFVVLSMVRSQPIDEISNPDLVQADKLWLQENLGFVRDEHQINVGITRSKYGLIIVGKLTVCDITLHHL